MKNQTYLFQKYQKKYFFFQKSFFDFLYWRSTQKKSHFSHGGASESFFEVEKQKQFHSSQKLYPFEQEKMSFYEYWKSSEQKKIENTLKTSTKLTFANPGITPTSFNLSTEKKVSSHLKQFSNSKVKKNTKFFSNSKKSLQFLTTQKFHLLFLKKRKAKMLNEQKKNFKNESFLPRNSSFEISQNLDFFKYQKFGEFFPKKKNFIQYWIFPFVGVLFFFSQKSSFLFSEKEKQSKNTFSFEPFQVVEAIPAQKFLPQKNTFFSIPKNKFNFQKTEQNEIHFFEYSFPQKNFTKTQFFQNLEKTEYEEFLKFYTKIFQNSLLFSETGSVPVNENFFFQGENSEKRNLSQKVFLQQYLQNKLEAKRNSFKWKWFSVTSNFLNNPQFMISNFSQIPQKAEFFVKNPLHFEIEKKPSFEPCSGPKSHFQTKTNFVQKPSTPLFDYSKNLFLVDELKRDFSFFPFSNSFSQPFFETSQFVRGSVEKKNLYFSHMYEMQKFFQNHFSFESQRGFSEENLFLKKSFHFKNKTDEEKKSAFLKKWSKTQKFSNLVFHQFTSGEKMKPILKTKKRGRPKLFSNMKKTIPTKSQIRKQYKSHFLGTPSGFEFSNAKNSKLSQNLMNLDALYFQKLFQNFKNQKLKKQFSLENFKNEQKQKNVEKTSQKFFIFKKHTFDFFTFESYNKKYKKFVYFLFTKNQKFKNSSFFIFEKNRQNERPYGKKSFMPLQHGPQHFENTFLFQLNHPILFQFSRREENLNESHPKSFLKFFEKFQKKSSFLLNENNETMKFIANTNIYPHKFSSSHGFQNFQFSFFPQFDKRKTKDLFFFDFGNFRPQSGNQNFSFQLAKSNFFEKFVCSLGENFFEKNLNNSFSKVYKFENFQKYFLFETNQFEKPFLFEKNTNIWTNFSFDGQKKKENKNFGMTHSFYLLKSKKKLSFLQYEIQKKGTLSNFVGFSKKQRKFEKIFRAFFSPLKDAKNIFFIPSQKKEKIFQKNKKDFYFLQSLSLLLKINPENFSSFYIPTNKKVLSHSAGVNKNESALQFQNLSFTKNKKLFNSFQQGLKKNRLSPQLVLKRDGFLTLNTSFSSQQNVDLRPDKISVVEKKNFSFQRLEKEKTLQKKRRLKKEKLETRRRKKRKRFFPRPVWLRMNLYKKFLKNRHSQKLFSFSSLSEKNSIPSLLVHFSQNRSFGDSNFFLHKKGNTSQTFFQKNKKQKWFQNTEKKQFNKYFLKKFQKQTQVLKRSSDFQKYNIDSVFFKKQNVTFQSKTYQKNYQKQGWTQPLMKKNSLFPLREATGIEKLSKNIDHYKISNEIYQEFLRLSWKSSWFQNNFKPYTRTIQENFQKIQSIESQKNFSNFLDIFKSKNFIFFFHDLPIFSEQSQNDFLVRKSVLQKFSWYSNVQNSFSSHLGKVARQESTSSNVQVEVVNFPQKSVSSLNFCGHNTFFSPPFGEENGHITAQKIPEYNRLLYVRISDILKKLKFSENMTNDSFFESLKGTRRKNEKIFSGSNNSFFTKTALFFEKFQVPSQPVIPAFSVFSSLFHNSSLKPTGDIPTLRSMWAFQKTNFSQFQERNSIQNLWAFKKRKDSFHSFKGTKKIMNFLRKKNAFEKFKTPGEFSSDWSIFVMPKYKTKNAFLYKLSTNFLPNQEKDFVNTSKDGMEKTFFLANKKGDFLTKDQGLLNTLDTMTLKKFINVEKKASFFGIQSLKQNSKISYRYLKFHFSPFYQNQKKFSFAFNTKKYLSSEINVDGRKIDEKIQTLPLFSHEFLKNKNPQNSAKSSLNFWWAQKPFQTFDFLGTSQFHTFADFSNGENLTNFQIFQTQKNNFSFIHESFPFGASSTLSFFLFGAFFFHFAVFYTLFKIPEIRSVFKFTLLIFSKFWNSFFVVFFSIYNIFKRYTKNGLNLLKTSSSFSKKKKIEKNKKQTHPFSMNGFFSQKECLNVFLKKTNGKRNFQTFSSSEQVTPFFNFANRTSSWGQSPLLLQSNQKNTNFLKQTKFNDFVFEFFPRFSVFSLSQKVFQNFEPFVNSQKESGYFLQNSNTFQNSFHFKKNLKHNFSKTKIFRNFDSSFLLKTFQTEFFPPFSKQQNAFSQYSLTQNSRARFFSTEFGKFEKHSLFSEQKLSRTEKNLSQFALSFLVFGKHVLFVPYRIFKLGSSFFTKIFEIVEGIFYAFYKFLEKPAEFMIEFIAFVFLIEWSSDILGFFPDSIESSMWKSSQKLLRPVRTGTFFLSFGTFFLGTSTQTLSKSPSFMFQTAHNFSVFSPFQFLLSTGFFQFSNFASYVLQKRLLYVFENFPSLLLQPDIDILVRQRKGIIFWDIWSEILLKAAEKYNVNLPSFVTLKEEQELFIEKLVRDSQFFESFDPQHNQKNFSSFSRIERNSKTKDQISFSPGESSEKNSLSQSGGGHLSGSGEKIPESQHNSTKSFSSFLQNFVIQNRPVRFFDFYFVSQKNSFFFQKSKTQKLQQFSISNLFSPGLDSKTFFQKFSKNQNFISNSFFNQQRKNEKFFPLLASQNENFYSLQAYRNIGKQVFVEDSLSSFQNMKKMDRWQCNQYATFQSQETDFFLDIYPPKSLKHVHFLKYYEPAHYTLGSFICQIYSGLFPKQISKNILVVGESGTAKTFFLRALAGETEMKIITENASRYAIVQRGVAVGMKYLRDVFDAIALQTPCFFVMEDLHIIGSKRPFMISENENTQNTQSSFGLEQQEVHETNQMIYQSSRHALSDFRRPYKGDFSMGIPTNYFLQKFYSPFFSSNAGQNMSKNDSSFYSLQKSHQFQNSQFFGGNLSSSFWNSLSSPLPIDSLEVALQSTGIQEKEKSNFESFYTKKNAKKIQSLLQFSKEQIFAPPATSPFTVLMMKEQKKLKPKKIVQETSWGGLSADQILLYQKESSSIRAKIAVLAEKTMNLSRGKFDMITDFLVIIDSVRSNRGFVVFGTTHKPSSLDPALRRPGRFDETLSLSRTPNFLNRFEIFKMNFENSVSTFDFFENSIFTENFSEMDLFDILSQTKLSFFHNYKYSFQKLLPAHNSFSSFQNSKSVSLERAQGKESKKIIVKKQLYSQISPAKAFHALLKSPLFEDFYTQKQFTRFSSKSMNFSKKSNFSLRNSNFFFDQRYTLLPKGPSHMLSLTYSKLGIFLAEANLLHDPTSFVPLKLDIDKNSSKRSNFQQYYGNVFFESVPNFSKLQTNGRKNQKNYQLLVFLSGKVAEFFISSSANTNQKSFSFPNFGSHISSFSTTSSSKQSSSILETKNSVLFEKPFSFFSEKFGIFENSIENVSPFSQKSTDSTFVKNSFKKFFFTKMNTNQVQQPVLYNLIHGKKDFYWTVYGNEESWRSATPFLYSLIQKRFLFTKNLLLSKMLFFENMDQRRKPPNPPGSSILMPSKKYENFKRTEIDFFQKAHFSIHEKIQMHQKQRFLKQLYNIPVQTHFRSELRKNHKTLFSSSFQEFAYLDSFVQKSSSIHSYYRKYIQVRHRFSNVNQWWNGMFPEHTRETTYLSDVDWRTMFVSSKVDSKNQKITEQLKLQKNLQTQTENSKKSSLSAQGPGGTETFEFLMDFPDAEQYYNPRNRRWFFKSNFQFAEKSFSFYGGGQNPGDANRSNSSFWSLFEKDLQYEIFSHYLMESFYQSFSYFEKKREMLDFFAFHLLYKGFLKEFDFLTTFSRF